MAVMVAVLASAGFRGFATAQRLARWLHIVSGMNANQNITSSEEQLALETAQNLEGAVKALSLPWQAGEISKTITSSNTPGALTREEMLERVSQIRSLLNEATSYLNKLEDML